MTWIVKGSGTAEFRGEHSCRVEFQTENTATGEIRRERKTFAVSAHTKKEKERCKREFRAELETGLDRDERTTTFGEYAARWLEGRVADPEIAEQTNDNDRWAIDTANITFGKSRLREITRMDVKAFQVALVTENEDGEAATLSGRPLSGTSASSIRKVFKQILQEAVRDGIIAANPCDDLKGPSRDTAEKEPLTPQQAAQFRALIDGSQPTAKLVAFRLALFAGLRRGEVCALKWRDFDAEAGEITVSRSIYEKRKVFKETKTEAGERVIPLDGATVAYLSEFKAQRIPALLALGRSVEDSCITTPLEEGREFMLPSYLTQMLPRYAKRHGLPRVTPHQLRHTYCTLLFAANVDLKTVQYLMGHADPSTTLKVYTHYVKSNGEKAAGAVEALIDSLPTAPRIVKMASLAAGPGQAQQRPPEPQAIAV